jgi:hypothetical protein
MLEGLAMCTDAVVKVKVTRRFDANGRAALPLDGLAEAKAPSRRSVDMRAAARDTCCAYGFRQQKNKAFREAVCSCDERIESVKQIHNNQ